MKTYATYWTFLKIIFKLSSLCFLLFIVNFFFGSCSPITTPQSKISSSEKIRSLVTKEDQVWMEEFFQEYFLGGSNIYTLFGTKPISGKFLNKGTKEECRQLALHYLKQEGIQGKEGEKILQEALDSWKEDELPKKWDKWVSFMKQHPNSPFLFAKHPTLSKRSWSGLILNVQETVWTLQKYYDLFKNEIGSDFDPVSVTMDFTNVDSPFWKQVFSNHLLTGILYGFGYKNSYFFERFIKLPNQSIQDSPLLSSFVKQSFSGKILYTIEDLPLPAFRSFRLLFNEDPVLEKYKLERKKIQSKLTEKNFFELVLLQVTGNLSKKF